MSRQARQSSIHQTGNTTQNGNKNSEICQRYVTGSSQVLHTLCLVMGGYYASAQLHSAYFSHGVETVFTKQCFSLLSRCITPWPKLLV